MQRIANILSALAVLIGLVSAFQGAGALGGSLQIGPIVAVAGFAVAVAMEKASVEVAWRFIRVASKSRV